jgi:ribosomal protein S18 acetylase RimI-like enzyme
MALIREYRPEDAAQVERCFVVLQEHERTVEPRRARGEAVCQTYLEHMHRRASETRGRVFVAEEDGRIVGFSCVWAHVAEDELINAPGEFAYISDLVVLAAFRGRGLGYELLRACERHAAAEGARNLRIGVLARNSGPRQLYERFGFEESSVEMSKSLEAN